MDFGLEEIVIRRGVGAHPCPLLLSLPLSSAHLQARFNLRETDGGGVKSQAIPNAVRAKMSPRRSTPEGNFLEAQAAAFF